jgi:hypothetical protein
MKKNSKVQSRKMPEYCAEVYGNSVKKKEAEYLINGLYR